MSDDIGSMLKDIASLPDKSDIFGDVLIVLISSDDAL
jgi:hypothetical protein